MSIVKNTFSTTNTPYFLNHTPYLIADTEQVVQILTEMISYDIIPPTSPPIVNNDIGAEEVFNFGVSFKNLTKTTTLYLEIKYGDLFIENDASTLILLPEKALTVNIIADKEKINNRSRNDRINNSIDVTVKIKDSPITIKNLLIQPYSQITLPSEFEIT
jgi:hypothetical protein